MTAPDTPAPRRILVPTDFSDTSQRAVSLALSLARRMAAEVHLLHVLILLDTPLLEEEQQHKLEDLLCRSEELARQALQPTVAEAEVRQVPFSTHLVRGISAAEAITESCLALDCDLVVMGTHGRRGLKHLLLGSVAEEVVRTAPVPVMTVRLDRSGDEARLTQILVPNDFSEHSLAAVQEAARWARILDARLTLLHVVEPLVYPELYAVDLLPVSMQQRMAERSAEALSAAAIEHLSGLTWQIRVASGHAAETIVRTAVEGGYGLVIMGTRGLSALEHLLLGSVAEHVVRSCPAPVLTVRRQPR